MPNRVTHLTVDVALDRAAGSIRGEIREGKIVRPFSGRLELLNELELWPESGGGECAEGGGDAPMTRETE